MLDPEAAAAAAVAGHFGAMMAGQGAGDPTERGEEERLSEPLA